MKRRNLTPQILAALRDTPVLYLQGPRQAGKSTLAQSLRGDGYDADYFTLDEAATLAAAQSDPDGFVAGLPERVILDEVQRVPELFRAIKRSVDAKRKPGRFLLTGQGLFPAPVDFGAWRHHDACVRTTLTLDPDVAAKAKRGAAKLGKPFKEVINAALRAGLDEILKPQPGKPYRTKPRPLGLRQDFSYDNISELLARAEGEDH